MKKAELPQGGQLGLKRFSTADSSPGEPHGFRCLWCLAKQIIISGNSLLNNYHTFGKPSTQSPCDRKSLTPKKGGTKIWVCQSFGFDGAPYPSSAPIMGWCVSSLDEGQGEIVSHGLPYRQRGSPQA